MLKHSLIMGMENNDKKCYTRQNTQATLSIDLHINTSIK